ncbi:MAG: shikimate kinase [Candidatus Didemnitutus sp.]|nr:shikimate kinase [Candidatus Didemnitutus sp.]
MRVLTQLAEREVEPRLPRGAGGYSFKQMETSRVNLYLVGFTGTGKSTVGRHAARALGYDFVDSDLAVEVAHGKSIAEIFAGEGEGKFRMLEREFVERGHPATGSVVACGGGLIVPDGMLELVKARGVTICLHAPLETVLQRTERTVHRPLLQGENRAERLRTLYAAREELYRRTGTMVLTEGRPMREIVAHVLRVYREEAGHWRAPSP